MSQANAPNNVSDELSARIADFAGGAPQPAQAAGQAAPAPTPAQPAATPPVNPAQTPMVAAPPMAAGGFAAVQPMMPAAAMGMNIPTPNSVSFRMYVPLPDGSEVQTDLHFSAENCPTPQHLQMLAAQVAQAWPLKLYQPRNQWGGGAGRRGGGYGGGQRRY